MFRKRKDKDLTTKDIERSVVESRAAIAKSNKMLDPDYTDKEFRPYYHAEDYVDHKDPSNFYRVSLLNVSTLIEIWEDKKNNDIILDDDYYLGQIAGTVYELNKYEKLRKEHEFEVPNLHKEAFRHAMENNVDRYTIGDKTFLIENVRIQIDKDGSFNSIWSHRLLEEKI